MNFDLKIQAFAGLIQQADTILIGAGSGLSGDAGIDYTDEQAFARNYPAMGQYGFTSNAQAMGLTQGRDPGLFWGYYLNHANHMCFGVSRQGVYQKLLALVAEKKEYFVITTNVDAFFQRNGFDPERIYTPQGDYGRFQCLKPCSDRTWDSEPMIKELLPLVDPVTGRLPRNQVPSCPHCAGPVFFNIRGGNWFIHTPYEGQHKRYTGWIAKAMATRMLVIEMGAGFHTPVWIRWPFETITRENPTSAMVRINREEPEVPGEIHDRALCFSNRAIEVLNRLSHHTLAAC